MNVRLIIKFSTIAIQGRGSPESITPDIFIYQYTL